MKEKSKIHINQEEIAEYLKDIRKLPVMTPERERELSEKMLSGNITEEEKKQIQKELLEGNLRFVITVSKQYQNQGLGLPDLVSEGNYGLMKAIENFDWSKKLRFISYAVWWVRQSILQSLNENARTIRLPVNVIQELQRAKKEMDLVGVKLPEKFSSLPYTINLDNPVNEEGDTLVDILVNPNAELADKNMSGEDILKGKLLDMLNVLDNRERLIIQDYFGLSGNTRTLEDIGNDFDLTKERVRQIKEKALRKLRNETGTLFDYL
jgi:RNA polymerase primary sigma factor